MFLIKTTEICKVRGDLEEASEGDWIQFERNAGGEGSCLLGARVYGGAPQVTEVLMGQRIQGGWILL